MDGRLLRFLGRSGKRAAGGLELRLIPAAALLQARSEAEHLAQGDAQALGLCLNACILARAAFDRDGRAAFQGGADVLARLPAETVARLTERYLALCAEEDPLCSAENRAALGAAMENAPYERLKWRVLRAFGVLPSEARAKEMTNGDYLYCVMNLALDEEQELRQMCPECRAEAEKNTCLCCGAPLGEENPNFDEARFEELKRGGVCR